MKSLQQYIYEHVDNVNEGEIWDAIKNWFKNFFDSSDKKFNRYDSEEGLTGSNLSNYIDWLQDNFEISDTQLRKIIDHKELKKIVYPNGIEPNYEEKLGFYEFIDNVSDKEDETEYWGLFYSNDECNDTIAIVNILRNGNVIEILNIQIIKEFIDLVPLQKLIDILKSNKEFMSTSSIFQIKKEKNKELYNKLINDCNFKEEYDKNNNENVAKLNIEKKK